MALPYNAALLFYYGSFLILCAIAAIVFIGWKAKTALMSGGTAGILAMVTGHYISSGVEIAETLGVLLSFALFCVFAWRSTKTFFTLIELSHSSDAEWKGKGIAFLIISLMAVVSIVVTLLQLTQASIS